MIRVDKDGKFFWLIPVAIGAIAGGYAGYEIGKANGAEGWDMFGYILGGAVVGGASGYLGYAVSTSGTMLDNTAGLITSSFANSVGMSILSGKNMAGINFGIGNFSFATGKVDWVGGNYKPFKNLKDFSTLLSDIYGTISVANDITAIVTGSFSKNAVSKQDMKDLEAEYDSNIPEGSKYSMTPYKDLEDGWRPLGVGDEAYNLALEKANQKLTPLVGKLLSGANELGDKPSIRFENGHIGLFKVGESVQTYLHYDLFNINKNWLYHLIEWLFTPPSPTVGR